MVLCNFFSLILHPPDQLLDPTCINVLFNHLNPSGATTRFQDVQYNCDISNSINPWYQVIFILCVLKLSFFNSERKCTLKFHAFYWVYSGRIFLMFLTMQYKRDLSKVHDHHWIKKSVSVVSVSPKIFSKRCRGLGCIPSNTDHTKWPSK